MTNEEYAHSLRLIADFYESHPDVPQPDPKMVVYGGDLVTLAKQIGTCRKVADDTFFNLQKQFEGVTIEFFACRNSVCKPIVVGKRVVPETIVPARPEQIIPGHEEEIIEWECPESLLSQTSDQSL